jgi:hypothetical protein
MSFLGSHFDPFGLTPHGLSLTWDPGLLWLHAGSDALVMLSYLVLPIYSGLPVLADSVAARSHLSLDRVSETDCV